MKIETGLMLFTSDLDELRLFYGERLGARIEDLEGGFLADLWGFHFAVEGGARPRRLSRRWMEESSVMISLKTDDFAGLTARLTDKGVELLGGVTESPDGERFAGFRDPDGNLFEISELTPLGSRPG